MRATSAVMVCAAILGLGCAPLQPRPAQPIPVAQARPSPDEAADRTRRAFTLARQKAEWGAMAGMFAEDGIIVAVEGDTVQGQEALKQYFTTPGSGQAIAVLHYGQFKRTTYLRLCTDGADERGIFYAAPTGAPGRYSIRWRWDSHGNAQIRRLELQDTVSPARRSRSECYSPTAYLHESSRFVLSLFGVWATGGYPFDALGDAMRAGGWDRKWYGCPSWGACAYRATPWPRSEPRHAGTVGLGILQFRVSLRVGAEVVVAGATTGSMLGIDTTTYPLSQVEYSWSERVWGAAVTYERWGIRIGAGPAFDPARWRGVQENTLNPNLRSEASGSLHPLGLLLDLGIHRGLISRLGIDVRAQARRFPATVLPGGYLGKRVSQNSAFVGIGLGTVF